MFKAVSSKSFSQIISKIPAPFNSFLSDYTSVDYDSMQAICYLADTNDAGYVIKPDGDIISVFSLPGAGKGEQAIQSAIENGGTKLDCMNGFLVEFYGDQGFEEYDRMAWNDDYAPKNWDYKRFGRPDIIFMKL